MKEFFVEHWTFGRKYHLEDDEEGNLIQLYHKGGDDREHALARLKIVHPELYEKLR